MDIYLVHKPNSENNITLSSGSITGVRVECNYKNNPDILFNALDTIITVLDKDDEIKERTLDEDGFVKEMAADTKIVLDDSGYAESITVFDGSKWIDDSLNNYL